MKKVKSQSIIPLIYIVYICVIACSLIICSYFITNCYLSLILFDMQILYYIVALYVLAFHHVKSLTKKMCKSMTYSFSESVDGREVHDNAADNDR